MMNSYFKNIPKRYYVVLLLFFSTVLKAYLTASPILVIADITADRKIIGDNGEITVIPAEFKWSPTEKGLALGAYAIGHILSAAGGPLVHRIGGANFMSAGMLGGGILALVEPTALCMHVYLFALARLIFGFFEGLTIIGKVDTLARWIPQNERVRALTFAGIGIGFGNAINFPLSGFIIKHLGWCHVFYIFGVIDLVWCALWIPFVSNSPSSDRFISKKEKDYLSSDINYAANITKKKVEIPYRDIFTSLPVYALLNEFFVAAFTCTFSKLLPLYIKDIYVADIQMVGLVSSIPLFASLILQPIFAYVADYLRSSGYKIGKLHKSILFWGQSLTVVFFFLSTIGNSVIACIAAITLAKISFGLSQVSYSAIIIDVAGQFAGFVNALQMVVRASVSFVNPIIITALVPNHTQSEWNVYFLFVGFLTMYGVIVFLIFGSGDLQPWARVSPDKVAEGLDNEPGDHKRQCELCTNKG